MADGELLDLVCGPASPLPESYQRYRLVAHLGSGGQAEVYRGVRLCGGVTSAPVTVKVFRLDPTRPLADELRSWDKGDAALMDLNNRGVAGICRRADGFYGPPPHRPGWAPQADAALPYQIYDYLHGVDLRQYRDGRAHQTTAGTATVGRLSVVSTLHTLATVLRDLHEPADLIACPVLHMDVKPSNVMVLTTGEVRLIDFTGARYCKPGEITQIAFTPETGGPEALTGEVGPPYDVHGFAAVAFFLVTGDLPRGRRAVPPEQHPALAGHPALRDLLLAGVAPNPADRPATRELTEYADRLATLVRAARLADLGLDWSPAVAPPAAAGGQPGVAGTETEAFSRIERLERELVQLRGLVTAAHAPGSLVVAGAYAAHPLDAPIAPRAPVGGRRVGRGAARGSRRGSPVVSPPAGSRRAAGRGQVATTMVENVMRASAPVVARPVSGADPQAFPQLPPDRQRMSWRTRLKVLKKGGGWTWFGVCVLFVGWGVWAIDTRGDGGMNPWLSVAVVLAVAAGVFAVLRLVGAAVLERAMNRRRRTAVLAHLGTAAFLTAAGIAYLGQAPWITAIVSYLSG